MTNQLILIKPWTQFQDELHKYVEQGNLIKSRPAETNDEFEELEANRLLWEKNMFTWLKDSFGNQINSMMIELNNAIANNFTAQTETMPVKDKLFQLRGRIVMKTNYLILKERLLNVSDVIIRPNTLQIAERANMTLKQKQRFILEKLFDLYDDNFYPVEEILIGNGVKLNRIGEASELTETLESMGHLETRQYMGQKVHAKLTNQGAMFIEESRQPAPENYEDIKFSPIELAQKMDEIKEKLNELGLGHEILYDELQELKELYKKLSHKNWGQLLKGKLFDLAISKIIDVKTFGFIYKELTDHVLKLL